MIDDNEDIINMTDEEAAQVLESTRIRLMSCRMNGKIKLTLSYNVALQKAIKALKTGKEENRPNWVPIKYRPLTEEERIHFSEYWGIEYCDTLSEKAFDCPMPGHKQEILLTTNWGVKEDVCLYDPDEGYSLEENGDWDGVIAWMPKPEPYKEAENDDT